MRLMTMGALLLAFWAGGASAAPPTPTLGGTSTPVRAGSVKLYPAGAIRAFMKGCMATQAGRPSRFVGQFGAKLLGCACQLGWLERHLGWRQILAEGVPLSATRLSRAGC